MDIEKLKDMTDKEMEIFRLESAIETEKITLDRYVEALVRSAFVSTCTGGAYFSKLFSETLEQGFKAIRESDKSNEFRDKLKHDLYFCDLFGSGDKIKDLEFSLAYHKRLVEWAKHDLEMLNYETKKEMVMDCMEQKDVWSEQFNRNSKVFKALEDE